jgi:hypothetical protein
VPRSTYFSVEHCARPKGEDGPKGVWLQCLACSELFSPSNPWRLVGDRRRRKKRQPRRLSAAHSAPAGQGRGPAWRRRQREATESVHRPGSCSTLAVAHAAAACGCGLLHAAACMCSRGPGLWTVPSPTVCMHHPCSTTSSPAIVTGHVQSCDKKIAKPPGCMCGPSLQHLRAAVNLGAIPPPVGLIPSATSVSLGVCLGRQAQLGVFDVGSPSQGLGISTPQVPTDHLLWKAHLPI